MDFSPQAANGHHQGQPSHSDLVYQGAPSNFMRLHSTHFLYPRPITSSVEQSFHTKPLIEHKRLE